MGVFELSDRDFLQFQKLVYEKCGINLHEGKKELVRARLGKRLREKRFDNFKSYYNHVVEDPSGEELIQLIDSISTNLTCFFREPKHFDFLSNRLLPMWQKEQTRNGPFPLRVWSAGCSSGEEPYSIAMWALENMENKPWADIRILATDISTRVLQTAVKGVYPLGRMEGVPAPLVRKYFQKGCGRWQGYVRVKQVLKNLIEFRRINLMEPFSFHEEFHLIFCRNVMIYFDKYGQEKLINRFYECLKTGGHLFVGHSESLMNLSHRYKYVQPAIYAKPGKNNLEA